MAFVTDKDFSWIDQDNRSYEGNPFAKNFFAGTWDMDQNNLGSYNAYISGYAYFVWTKLPRFFSPEMQKKFKFMTERNFKSFSGLGNMTVDTDQINAGFSGNNMEIATGLKKEDGGFTLKHQEYHGSPIRKLYEYWVYGIRDIETGLATYHGKIAKGEMNYSIANHTGEGVYIVTDPAGAAGGASSLEYAVYFTNVFPTTIPQDHMNYNAGEHTAVDLDIEFKGMWHRSKKINELAVKIMKTRVVLPTFGDYGIGSINDQQDLVANNYLGCV